MGEGAGCGGGERAGDKAKGRAAVPGGVLGEGGSQGPGREDLESLRRPDTEEGGHCLLRGKADGWVGKAGRCSHLLV